MQASTTGQVRKSIGFNLSDVIAVEKDFFYVIWNVVGNFRKISFCSSVVFVFWKET